LFVEAEQTNTNYLQDDKEVRMGSSQSKVSKRTRGVSGSNADKADPPIQEKHTSADSNTPLTHHASEFFLARNSSLDRQDCICDSGLSLAHAHTSDIDEIQVLPSRLTATHSRPDQFDPSEDLIQVPIRVDELEGHSNVTRPPRPPRLRHLSELIDPAELDIDSHIRSPSGTILALEQFLVHPDRPRSMRERQEQIREKVRAASQLGAHVRNSEEEKPSEQTKGSKKKLKCFRWCCGCFGKASDD
jgi:hypothetical protein